MYKLKIKPKVVLYSSPKGKLYETVPRDIFVMVECSDPHDVLNPAKRETLILKGEHFIYRLPYNSKKRG